MSYLSSLPTSSLQQVAIALEILFPAITVVIIALRTYVRTVKGSFGLDDALVITAAVLAVGLAISSIIAIRLDCIGVHYWEKPADWDYHTAFLWLYVMGIMYNPIVGLVKLSVLVFILRFSGVKTTVRYIVWATSVFTALQMVAVLLVMVFDCVPFAKNWDIHLEGRCVDAAAFAMASSCFQIATDAVALALPFYIFSTLKMSRRRRAGLLFVFSLGILATIFSCVRLYFINELEKSTDPDANYSLTTTYSAVEVNLAIWAGSVPALWPLIRQGRRLGDHLGTTARYNGYGESHYTSRMASGWVRTGDRGDEEDMELAARGVADVRTECKASTAQQGVDGAEAAGGIRKTFNVEVTVVVGRK